MAEKAKAKDPEVTTICVPKAMLAKIRVVADHHKCTHSQALERFGMPGVMREYRKVLEELNREIGGESGT